MKVNGNDRIFENGYDGSFSLKSNIPIRLEIASRVIIMVNNSGFNLIQLSKHALLIADTLIDEHNKSCGEKNANQD